MRNALPERQNSSRITTLYLAYIALWLIGLTAHYLRMRSAWIYGSWLINYSAGFVRRGLSGELLLRLAHHHFLYATAALELLCFVPIFLAIHRRAARAAARPLWFWALLLSPATLAFPIFDSSIAFRQEILLLALLATLILCIHRLSDSALSALLALACPAILLCHEGLICFFPYLIAALYLALGSLPRLLKVAALPAILSLAAVALATTHTGNALVAHRVCESLGNPAEPTLTGICGGSIKAMQDSQAVYQSQVTTLVHDPVAVREFALTIPLSLLPIALALADLKRRHLPPPRLRTLILALTASAAASLLLFINAMDWARWVYTHILCMTLLLLWANTGLSAAQPIPIAPRRFTLRAATAAIALFLYATCWNLPYYPSRSVFGYAGVLGRYIRRITPTTDTSAKVLLRHSFLEPGKNPPRSHPLT